MEASIARKFAKSVEIARALKLRLATGRCFHVTTIFDKNKLISIGSNNYNKTHPTSLKYRKRDWDGYVPSIHSELSAILRLGEENCSDYLFFNVRIDKNDQVNNSRPCSGCEEMMRQIRFNKFFYSTATGGVEEYQF